MTVRNKFLSEPEEITIATQFGIKSDQNSLYTS